MRGRCRSPPTTAWAVGAEGRRVPEIAPRPSLGHEELPGPDGARRRVESAHLAAQRLVLRRHAHVDGAARDEGRGPGERVGRGVHRTAPAGWRPSVRRGRSRPRRRRPRRPPPSTTAAWTRSRRSPGTPHARCRCSTPPRPLRRRDRSSSCRCSRCYRRRHDRRPRPDRSTTAGPDADQRPESRHELAHVGGADHRVAPIVVGAAVSWPYIGQSADVGTGRWRCRPCRCRVSATRTGAEGQRQKEGKPKPEIHAPNYPRPEKDSEPQVSRTPTGSRERGLTHQGMFTALNRPTRLSRPRTQAAPTLPSGSRGRTPWVLGRRERSWQAWRS